MTFPRRAALAALLLPLSALLAAGTVASASAAEAEVPDGGDFAKRVVATGLSNPFEVAQGPDRRLWVTERTSREVTQVDPATGAIRTILTVPDVVITPGTQDGLLGMAIHPGLRAGGPTNFVYLAYTYDANSGSALDRKQKLVRYTYRTATRTLDSPRVVISGLPASNDHNSGRLVLAPDGRLNYTIGDRGNNHNQNACRPNLAQRLPTTAEVAAKDWTAYQGKTLRLNTDGSVPSDNPTIKGVRSHVFTYGHRNPQGLVFAPSGRLYSSEQGPRTDDEINLLRAGGNYGWPNVAGYKDDSAYVYANWSAATGCGTTVQYDEDRIPAAVPQQRESSFSDPAFVPPLRAYYTVPTGHDFTGSACDGSGYYFVCYPTIAPSSLDYYAGAAIPGWKDSLLMTTLKTGRVYRVPVGADGRLSGASQPLWISVNRYRDTAIASDGATIYVATDSAGITRGGNGDATQSLANPGSILAFRYDPARG
ncbi:glucose/sorbosone family PQQ-dependent dehydrogenase [Planctomonas deserti]|uniref:glucose/sorbosone family PQQ-dependent dehydrogenase n=1 Tax=Planctomonas deserti TaxID=2144185 RepID=UPI000D332F02|nr:glucose/sorbosone family PQQ-dependent dehydrogenase [Planctomonas deserti]